MSRTRLYTLHILDTWMFDAGILIDLDEYGSNIQVYAGCNSYSDALEKYEKEKMSYDIGSLVKISRSNKRYYGKLSSVLKYHWIKFKRTNKK